MIYKYEGGQSLPAIAYELGFVISTVNIVIKDAARIKKQGNFILSLVHVCLSISTVSNMFVL
jgi:hypothetical protein